MKIFQESVGLYLLYVILIGICLGLIFVSFNPSSILLRWLCPPSAGQPTRTALLNRNELQLSDHCFPPDNVDDDHGDDDKEEEEVWWSLVERREQQGASYLQTHVVVCAGYCCAIGVRHTSGKSGCKLVTLFACYSDNGLPWVWALWSRSPWSRSP